MQNVKAIEATRGAERRNGLKLNFMLENLGLGNEGLQQCESDACSMDSSGWCDPNVTWVSGNDGFRKNDSPDDFERDVCGFAHK